MRRPDLATAVALNGVMVLSISAVLAVPVLAPAIAAETGLPPSLIGAYSFFMWSAAILAFVLSCNPSSIRSCTM